MSAILAETRPNEATAVVEVPRPDRKRVLIIGGGFAGIAAAHALRHADVAPDLFTAETPLGTYQGMTDQVVLSRTPGLFRTVLMPRGSSKPEWLAR